MNHSTNSSQSVTAEERKLAHYPSLELCKKLTEAGFPMTEKFHMNGGIWDSMTDRYISEYASWCPNVMELLDEMPQSIDKGVLQICHDCHDDGSGDLYWCVEYSAGQSGYYPMETCDDNKGGFPNALAEMWIWLKENNYLTI